MINRLIIVVKRQASPVLVIERYAVRFSGALGRGLAVVSW